MGRGKKGARRSTAARKQAALPSSPAAKSKPKPQSFPVPGLSNLGNTCFFNAVLQNLSQSHNFTVRLAEHLASPNYNVQLKLPEKEEACRLDVTDDTPGALAVKLHSFLGDMQQHGGSTLNPRPVFNEICNKAPRFHGYHQQDSQELLRYLLDSLRTEELNRIKRAILFSFGVKDQNKKKVEKSLSDQDRKDIKGYGYQALLAHTFVDDVFGGVLDSTIQCRACGDRTTLHETFLDLSLPIPEDKNMAELPSPSGHFWSRSRRKGAGRKEAEEGNVGESLPPLSATKKEPKTLTKHQLKKEKARLAKEAKRAAKIAAKKTLSLQQFHKETEEEEEEEAELKQVERRDSEEPTTCDGNATPPSIDTQPKEGEENETTFIEVPSEESAVTRLADDVETLNVTESHDITMETEPTESCTERDINNTPAISPEEESSDTTQHTLPQQCSEDESKMEVHCQNSPAAEVDTASKERAEVEEDEEEKEEEATRTAEEVPLEADSLLACFTRFCTLELLTGDNKLACDVCSKRCSEAALTSALQRHSKSETATTADSEDGAQTNCGSPPQSPEQQQDDGCRSSAVEGASNSQDEVTAAPVSMEGSGSQQSGQEEEEEAGGQDGGAKVVDNQENDMEEGSGSLQSPAPSPSGGVVFSEATKQLLLSKAPPTLTLHLKRFLQLGKKLRKNNIHISFPSTLDLSPFCIAPALQGVCDGQGRLLYALYGVVEHSGGMQGGHYTAFVRVREKPTCRLREDTPNSSETVAATPQITVSTPPCVAMATSNNSSGELAETTKASDPKVAAVISNGNTSSASDACSSSRDHKSNTMGHSLPEEDEDGLTFDLSSVGTGQWYHVSDSRVRAASESEVMKCQAYVLFYEQLPLLRHSTQQD